MPAASVPSAVPLPTRRQRFFRSAVRIGRSVLIIYLLVLLVLSYFQEYLIFAGSSMTQGTADAKVTFLYGVQRVNLTTAGGDRTVAAFALALTPQGNTHPDAAHCPTIIYFYGNAMCLAQTDWEIYNFRRLGCNVLIPELVGYGLASGKPSEANCYATADAAFEYLKTRPDIDHTKIIPAGWSLGAAIACDLAVRKQAEGVAGLMLVSPFTSLDDQAAHLYPFVPVGLLLKHHFRSIEKIPAFRQPLLLIHGEEDNIIPVAMSGRLQAAATASPKVTRVVIPGVQHNDIYAVGSKEVLDAMRAYLAPLLPSHP